MAELGFVNDEIAAKKAADSIDLADYSDEKAVEREYRKLAMEAIRGPHRRTRRECRIRCHLHSGIKASITPAPHSIKSAKP